MNGTENMQSKEPILSGVVLARNEVATVEKTLRSLREVCDEVVFVDGMSEDGTFEIARKYSDKVYSRPPRVIVEVERAFALSQAIGDWIIYLDGDEWLSESLKSEIRSLIKANEVNAYGLVEQLFQNDKILKWGFYRHNYQVRLYRRTAVAYAGIIHELPKINGITKDVDFPIIHFDKESWSPIPKRNKRWLKVYAAQTRLTHSRLRHILWSFRNLLHDLRKFLIIDQAYRDGVQGIEMSIKISFYLFLYAFYAAVLSSRSKACTSFLSAGNFASCS